MWMFFRVHIEKGSEVGIIYGSNEAMFTITNDSAREILTEDDKKFLQDTSVEKSMLIQCVNTTTTFTTASTVKIFFTETCWNTVSEDGTFTL